MENDEKSKNSNTIITVVIVCIIVVVLVFICLAEFADLNIITIISNLLSNLLSNSCDCLNNGTCDKTTKVCICPVGYIGTNCEIVYKSCPNNCSNHGTCDTNTGLCKCDDGYKGLDCLSPINCTNNCSNHGTCDDKIKLCDCTDGYSGDDCSNNFNKKCTKDDECSTGLLCNTTTGLCDYKDLVSTYVDPITRIDCKNDTPCATGYYCDTNLGNGGKCSRKISDTRRCDSNNKCMSGECKDSRCVTACLNNLNQPDDSKCGDSRYCAGTTGSAYCTNKIEYELPCTTNNSCSTGNCYNGKCVSKFSDGQPCTENITCNTGYCKDGKCAKKADGEECNADDNCLSLVCDRGPRVLGVNIDINRKKGVCKKQLKIGDTCTSNNFECPTKACGRINKQGNMVCCNEIVRDSSDFFKEYCGRVIEPGKECPMDSVCQRNKCINRSGILGLGWGTCAQ